jgi:mono/diheme cytochrome c family protein
VGPRLAGRGLTRARIVDQIRNGGGGMPAGLVTGKDLEAVAAYVRSLQ